MYECSCTRYFYLEIYHTTRRKEDVCIALNHCGCYSCYLYYIMILWHIEFFFAKTKFGLLKNITIVLFTNTGIQSSISRSWNGRVNLVLFILSSVHIITCVN